MCWSAAELLLCVEPAARSELSAILKAPRQSTLGTLFIVFAWSHPKNVFIFCLSLKFYVNTVCETYAGLFFVSSTLYVVWKIKCGYKVIIIVFMGQQRKEVSAAVVSYMCSVSVAAMCSNDIHIQPQRGILLCLCGPWCGLFHCPTGIKIDNLRGFLLLYKGYELHIWYTGSISHLNKMFQNLLMHNAGFLTFHWIKTDSFNSFRSF